MSFANLEPISFITGFLTATILWFVVTRSRPLIDEMRQILFGKDVHSFLRASLRA